MKRKATSALALILIGAGIFRAFAEEKPKAQLVTGEIQCLYCTVSNSDMGSASVGCIERCITKNGMAPIIVQEGTGDIYVVVGKNGESPVNKLKPLIGKKINAQGAVYEKKGIYLIELGIIAEAM